MRVEKPWGYEIIWASTGKYVGKILFIRKGHKLSLQYHNVKDETIYVSSGTLTLQIASEMHTLHPGDRYHITPGLVHRMIADQDDVTICEVSTPELEDVVRLQDSYGRTT